MKIKTFIDRPILAMVISVVILIVGLIGLSQLPVEQFPEIAPPTVSVSASYTGANAETVQNKDFYLQKLLVVVLLSGNGRRVTLRH